MGTLARVHRLKEKQLEEYMRLKIWFSLLISLVLFAACAPVVETEPPTPVTGDPNATAMPQGSEIPPLNPYAPGKGDESMSRGEVYIDSLSILVLESFPPQYQLQVQGYLPTPCHQLRAIVDEPTIDSEIHVQVYSVVDPNMACIQVLEPFEVNIPLGSYVRGSYTVFVNGEEVGKITP